MTLGTQLTRRPHPSNRLQANDVAGFVEAMQVYQRQMHFENEMTERLAAMDGKPITPEERVLMEKLTADVGRASTAINIYMGIVEAAEKKAIETMRADGRLDDFADALESGDYSTLAI